LANHQKEQRKTFSSAVKYIQTEKHRKRYLQKVICVNSNACTLFYVSDIITLLQKKEKNVWYIKHKLLYLKVCKVMKNTLVHIGMNYHSSGKSKISMVISVC